MLSNKKIGLALSGGGYRAAVYHLGTLRKLHELGILQRLDVMSTISGGSITGAAYCLSTVEFPEFDRQMFEKLTTKNMIRHVLLSWKFMRLIIFALVFLGSAIYLQFTALAPISIPIIFVFIYLLIRYQFKLFPVSEILEDAYNKFFYQGAVLSQLHESPRLAIGATNLQTLRPFTFSKNRMSDSKYSNMSPQIHFNQDKFPVARAVMASSCVPFAFTPISIHRDFYVDPQLYGIVNPQLVDGGVYDNQGAHKLTQTSSSYKCDIVIVSDAGDKLPFEKSYNNTFNLLLRTVNTFMARIKHFQLIQHLYSKSQISVSFQSIGWDLDESIAEFCNSMENGNISVELCEHHQFEAGWVKSPAAYRKQIIERLELNCGYVAISSRGLTPERMSAIRKVGTNLTPIKEDLAKDLVTYAELITELQVRLYCPQLLKSHAV